MIHVGLVPLPFGTSQSSVLTGLQYQVREHARHGGTATAIVSHNRDATVPLATNMPVDYTENCPREWFSRPEVAADALRGYLGRPRQCPKIFLPAIRELKRLAPDVVVIYQGDHALQSLPYWRSECPSLPIAIEFHAPLSRLVRRHELRKLMTMADLLVFVSDHDRQRAERRAGGLPTRYLVNHNAIDHSVFHAKGRPPSGDKLRIAFAGEVAAHKGPHLLIEAISQSGLAAHLTVIGSSRQRFGADLTNFERELRSRTERLTLDAEFFDHLTPEALANRFRCADIIVVPSVIDEAFGRVAVEAMACGAAVIASLRGGLPEACGEAALLVEPTDTAALAQALTLMADDDDRLTYQRKGLARVQELTWHQNYRRLHSTLEEISRQPREPASPPIHPRRPACW